MWKLEAYRIITSVAGWMPAGEYRTIGGVLESANQLYGLEFRAISPDGKYHSIIFEEDPIDSDYVIPKLGPECSDWPQFVGNVRS